MFLPNWSGGRDAAVDITVINPLQSSLVARTATEPGYALIYQYNKKWQKYVQICHENGIVFHPIPLETMGGFGGSSINLIKRLGQSLGRATGQDETETTQHLFGRLSIQLMKGNCSLLINRIPNFPDPSVDGVN